MDKAHILREIKRTADANGGMPLGWRRFLNETGVKRSDWCGVHWARWGDAVREAGYEPNQLIEAITVDELLIAYTSLAQELGRLPTTPDIRMKGRNDPDYPDDRTFDRLGPKLDLVKQVLTFCREREGYEDVAGWCETYLARKGTVSEPNEPTTGDVVMGYVYLIKMEKYYKIGMTNSVGRREYELNLLLPKRTEIVHVIATDDPAGIEEYWHKRFAVKNTNGEWFALAAADIAAFKRRKFM